MELIADMHTHTLASTHAYSTVLENAKAAAEGGLRWLGWTDHAPSMPDAPHPWHFQNISAVPDCLHGVRVLKGVETSIIGYDGALDFPAESLRKLEWVIASIHRQLLPAKTEAEHTAAYLGAAGNPHVDAIGHCIRAQAYPFAFETVVKAVKEYGKLLEFTEATLRINPAARKSCVELAGVCMKYECPIVVDSDAHFADSIGRAGNVLRMLEEIGFPERLVVNASEERFGAYLESREARHNKV